jgi:O-antigen chain-terminating methyltransferase
MTIVGSVKKRFLGPLLSRLARALGISEIQSRIDSLYGHSKFQEDLSAKQISALDNYLESRIRRVVDDQQLLVKMRTSELRLLIDEMQQKLTSSSISHTETVTHEIRVHLEKQILRVTRDIDNMRRTIEPSQTPERSPHQALSTSEIDDSLYISLEDYFRGDQEEVKSRQESYLEFVREVVTPDHPLLDLGCGRGEWLQLLQAQNIQARGIDSNIAAIEECKEKKLDVTQGDLVATLEGLPESSYGAITMFQVLEHLPFQVMVKVLREALRVLKPGGVFIGEIPNSETLRVGASTFWIDPTHQKPVFPGLLVFLATTVGYSSVNGKYSSPLAPEPNLEGLPTEAAETLRSLFQAVNGPGDFALIATA